MAAKSDYFRAVMSSQLREAKENEVRIGDLNPEIMKTVIEFCYTNQVSLNDDNFHQVLSAAFRFCMESLKQMCIKFIELRITASNCTGLIHSFKQYGLKHLLDIAIGFSAENFDILSAGPELVNISEDVWDLILPQDKLNLSECGIFRALVKWTEHDLDNRKAAFERSVKHVRFATIDATELSELSNLELATMSESCKELIAKARFFLETERQDEQSKDEPLPDVSATPRRNLKNGQRMYAIGGCRHVLNESFTSSEYLPKTLSSVEIYDPNADEWTEATPMQSPRSSFGCAVLGDYIYVAGGASKGEILKTFERYSIANDTWERLPDMIKTRRDMGLVALDGYLYAIGGSDSSGRLDMVERFRPGDIDWSDCTRMNLPRSNAAYAALDGYIYAIGGDGEIYFVATLERYDPKTDSWCNLSSLFRIFERLECTSYGGKIYVKGYDVISRPNQRFFVYNTSTDRWSKLPRAPTNRRRIRLAELGRELYAVGGQTEDLALNLVESYNPETRQWRQRTGMLRERADFGLVVHPPRIYYRSL